MTQKRIKQPQSIDGGRGNKNNPPTKNLNNIITTVVVLAMILFISIGGYFFYANHQEKQTIKQNQKQIEQLQTTTEDILAKGECSPEVKILQLTTQIKKYQNIKKQLKLNTPQGAQVNNDIEDIKGKIDQLKQQANEAAEKEQNQKEIDNFHSAVNDLIPKDAPAQEEKSNTTTKQVQDEIRQLFETGSFNKAMTAVEELQKIIGVKEKDARKMRDRLLQEKVQMVKYVNNKKTLIEDLEKNFDNWKNSAEECTANLNVKTIINLGVDFDEMNQREIIAAEMAYNDLNQAAQDASLKKTLMCQFGEEVLGLVKGLETNKSGWGGEVFRCDAEKARKKALKTLETYDFKGFLGPKQPQNPIPTYQIPKHGKSITEHDKETGKLIKETYYQSDGTVEWIAKYDKDTGKETEYIKYKDPERTLSYITEYDKPGGKEIAKTYYHDDGKTVRCREEYEYNKVTGKMIKRTCRQVPPPSKETKMETSISIFTPGISFSIKESNKYDGLISESINEYDKHTGELIGTTSRSCSMSNLISAMSSFVDQVLPEVPRVTALSERETQTAQETLNCGCAAFTKAAEEKKTAWEELKEKHVNKITSVYQTQKEGTNKLTQTHKDWLFEISKNLQAAEEDIAEEYSIYFGTMKPEKIKEFKDNLQGFQTKMKEKYTDGTTSIRAEDKTTLDKLTEKNNLIQNRFGYFSHATELEFDKTIGSLENGVLKEFDKMKTELANIVQNPNLDYDAKLEATKKLAKKPVLTNTLQQNINLQKYNLNQNSA